MPRNKEQNEQIRQERKRNMLKGALKVYVDKGYAAAEIGDVAAQAEVARGLVYYYFKDKKTLFRELFTFMIEQSKRHVETHFAAEGSRIELLEKFAQSFYRGMMDHPEHVLFFMRMRHDLHELFTTDELKTWNWHVDYMKTISTAMQQGMDAGEIRAMAPPLLAAQYWAAVMHGMFYLRQLHQELKDQGKEQKELEETMRLNIRDAITGCLALITPPTEKDSKGEEVR